MIICRSPPLHKKFSNSELFWSAFPAFSCIRTECGEIRSITPYSVRMRENVGKMWTRITPNTDSFHAIHHLHTLIILNYRFICKINIRGYFIWKCPWWPQMPILRISIFSPFWKIVINSKCYVAVVPMI